MLSFCHFDRTEGLRRGVSGEISHSSSPSALLLAGGFATRLWPLTEKRSKPLLPLAGKPLISHIIENLPAEIRLIISTNRAFETDFTKIQAHYPDRNIEIFIEDSGEEKEKKGAITATALAIDHFGIRSPLLLIAADNYFGFPMQRFLDAYVDNTLLAAVDIKSLEKARQFGVLTVEGKTLKSFAEKPENPSSTLVSTGCYLFSPKHLADIKTYAHQYPDHLGGIFEWLIRRSEPIDVFTFDQPWFDIGSFESYLLAEDALLPGTRVSSSATVTGSQLGTTVEVGDRCTITNSTLERCIIFEDCVIRDSNLRACVIDKGCYIEGVDLTQKMIRAGTVIKG